MSDQDVNEETPIAGTTDSGGKSRKQCIIISVLLLIFLAVIAAGVLAYVFLKDKDEDPTIKPTTETEGLLWRPHFTLRRIGNCPN